MSQDNKVDLSFIVHGKPQQNPFVENLNGEFRKECLDLNFSEIYYFAFWFVTFHSSRQNVCLRKSFDKIIIIIFD